MTLNCVNNNKYSNSNTAAWEACTGFKWHKQHMLLLLLLFLLLLLSFEHLSAHVSQTNEFVQIYREPNARKKSGQHFTSVGRCGSFFSLPKKGILLKILIYYQYCQYCQYCFISSYLTFIEGQTWISDYFHSVFRY